MWKPTKKQTTIGMLLLGFLLALGLFMSLAKKTRSPKDRMLNKLKSLGMNEETAKTIVAVSQHETANYTSALSKPPYNNFFGMHNPKGSSEGMAKRKTTSKGEDSAGWAKFDTLEDSVQDYINWWGYYGIFPKGYSTNQLVEYMKNRGYFTDTLDNYLKGVKSWL